MIFYAHFLLWYIQQCKLRLPPFEQHGVAFSLVVAEGDILPVDVPVARLQLSDQRAWVSFRSPKAGMVRHCRQAWQAKDCLFRTAGTSRRSSACLSAGVRQPAALSWFVPNTFARQQAVSVPHIRWCFSECQPQNTSCSAPPARKWQPVDCRLPSVPSWR